jgi:hypothetical protein
MNRTISEGGSFSAFSNCHVDMRAAFREIAYFSHFIFSSKVILIGDGLIDYDTPKLSCNNVNGEIPEIAIPGSKKHGATANFGGLKSTYGFLRTPISSKSNEGRPAQVFPFVSIDETVCSLLAHYQSDLLEQYATMFDKTIHDYMHGGTFLAGRYPIFQVSDSPINRLRSNINGTIPIDKWYSHMSDAPTDFESWASLEHREVMQDVFRNNPEKKREIIVAAKKYIEEVSKLQRKIIEDSDYSNLGRNSDQTSKREHIARSFGEYMMSIYLWPLQLILLPEGPEFAEIENFMKIR